MAAAFNMPAFAQQKISIRISVKNGLTKNAFDDNVNTPTFDVCNVEDSTRIKSSNIRFGENLIGNITADKSKYLIHVFVFDVDRDGDVEPSTKYEDEWLTLDVDKVKKFHIRSFGNPKFKARETTRRGDGDPLESEILLQRRHLDLQCLGIRAGRGLDARCTDRATAGR